MRHKRIPPILFAVSALALSMAPAADAQSTMPDFALPSWSDVSWRHPANYETIQTADVDGDGDDELLGRSDTQVEVHDFDPTTGHWIPLPSVGDPGTFGNEGGWDLPGYYSTIQAGNLDGRPGDEIYGRSAGGIQVWTYNAGAHDWVQLPDLDAFGDDAGWGHPEYYSTIQSADVDGDGKDEIVARSVAGLVGYTFDAGSRQWDQLMSNPWVQDPSDANGWNQAQYYSTIQAANIDGDPGEELFGRSRTGITAWEYDGSMGVWNPLLLLEGAGAPSDANGWDQAQYYSTIQAADIDGDGVDELFGRGGDAVSVWKYDGNAATWRFLPELSGLSDAGGWNQPQYYSTITHGDVDGDGREELLARGSDGMHVWTLTGSGWATMPGESDLCDRCGWNLDYHYPSIQTTRTGLNQADQLIGRGSTGVVTYSFDSQANQWGPATAQFPAYTTGDTGAAYQAINQYIGGAYNPGFDMRQGYATATSQTLQNWQGRVTNMPAPANVPSQAFHDVQTQILTELSNAIAVNGWYASYLTQFTDALYLAKNMDDSAQVLNYATSSEAELGMEEMDVVEGMLESLNALDLLPAEAGEAAVVVNSLLGGGFAAGLGVDGVNSAIEDEVQGTYFQIQQRLQSDFSNAVAGNADAEAAIQGDYGLQSAVAALISSGAWTPLSGSTFSIALANAEQDYSVSVWQTITPAIWTAYEFTPGIADEWCLFNNSCDWHSPGDTYWELEWNYSAGSNCAAFNASLGPCAPAPANLRSQLFGQTSSGCQTAWSASCNLGESYSDVFLGQNGWEDLPAYYCQPSGWADTPSCGSLRGAEPGAPRRAGRVNLGGPKLTAAGSGWFGCQAENRCQAVVRGGMPAQPRAQVAIRGAKAPARRAVYRTGWRGRPGRRGTEAFRLEVPAAGGAYRLRLHFAETRRTRVGRHRFDVDVEGGVKELSGFDVMAAAGGRNRALVREFPMTVRDGSVTVRFLRRKGAPIVRGVELIPVARPGATPARSRLRLGAVRDSRGRLARLSGRLRVQGMPRRRLVAIEARVRGTRVFETVTAVQTRPTGRFTAKVRLPANVAAIRARFAGDATAQPAVSAARRQSGRGRS
jgi:hypothetical protein